MIHSRTATMHVALAIVLALGACGKSPPMARTTLLTANLSGTNEVPAVIGGGSGTVQVHLNKQTNVVRWTIEYAGLSGPVTAGNFHGPAVAGENAGVVVPMADVGNPIKGTATLTAAQSADLLDGKWYVNLHTAGRRDGEIRGQVISNP